jgi:hypothetical protein
VQKNRITLADEPAKDNYHDNETICETETAENLCKVKDYLMDLKCVWKEERGKAEAKDELIYIDRLISYIDDAVEAIEPFI